MAGPLSPGPAAATRVPVLAMAGGADRLVPARLVRAYYDALPPDVPHGYLRIAGAGHGAYGTGCAGRQRTCGIVASYATSFFLAFLDGRRGASRLLDPRTPRAARLLLRTVRIP
jgi:pimeloyl-ACP methyl ester carboxylesterase